MGKLYPELDQRLRKFIADQPVFFVATAPCLSPGGTDGHVNVSPKGYRDTFAVLGPTTVAYLDLTGSGTETIAHLRQNGQITIMFCSFDRQPKILRLYGSGTVVVPGEPRWQELAGLFPDAGLSADHGNRRAIILVEVHRIADSCGYSVPRMELVEERDLLMRWAENKTAGELADYRVEKNSFSIDGLPALSPALSPALDPALSPALDPALSPAVDPALSPALSPALGAGVTDAAVGS
jgi:Pyridoxamine 5'-phosphate oxidase